MSTKNSMFVFAAAVLALTLVAVGPAQAAPSVLDIEGLDPAIGYSVPQTYGDNLANTPNVTVDWGTAGANPSGFGYWNNAGGYGLNGSGYTYPNAGGGEVTFTADAGYLVELEQFLLASSGSNSGVAMSVSVDGGAYTSVFSGDLVNADPQTVAVGLTGQTVALRLDSGSSMGNLGFDDYQFSQQVVPEPSTLVLLGLGLLGLLAYAWRKRK